MIGAEIRERLAAGDSIDAYGRLPFLDVVNGHCFVVVHRGEPMPALVRKADDETVYPVPEDLRDGAIALIGAGMVETIIELQDPDARSRGLAKYAEKKRRVLMNAGILSRREPWKQWRKTTYDYP